MTRCIELDRFWSKVDQSGDCWLWTAGKGDQGYGHFAPHHGQMVYAHRLSYEEAHGPIPEGLQIDHLCRNRACVNPAHLEAVTQAENIRRAAEFQTHCRHGHLYDEANTERHAPRFERKCRTCRIASYSPEKRRASYLALQARRTVPA